MVRFAAMASSTSGGSVLLEGAITGPGGMKIVGPDVEYAGSAINTYTGLTSVRNGTLRLNKSSGPGFAGDLTIGITFGADDNERVILLHSHQIPDASDVTITSTGWLNLNGFNDTVHDITMTSARLSTGGGLLTLRLFDCLKPLIAACNGPAVGVGITMGLNTVACTGCRSNTGSMNGARFFSPFYAYHNAQSRDKDFIAAGGRDDIEFALWGLAKVLHQMLLEAGQNLNREGFILSTEKMQNLRTGIFPELNYSPSNHFGANQVHVLRADCSKNAFVTESYFRSSF